MLKTGDMSRDRGNNSWGGVGIMGCMGVRLASPRTVPIGIRTIPLGIVLLRQVALALG